MNTLPSTFSAGFWEHFLNKEKEDMVVNESSPVGVKLFYVIYFAHRNLGQLGDN